MGSRRAGLRDLTLSVLFVSSDLFMCALLEGRILDQTRGACGMIERCPRLIQTLAPEGPVRAVD